MATKNTNPFSISVSKTFSKIVFSIIILANVNSVLAVSKSSTVTQREQELNSEKILIADFFQDVSNKIKREQRVREREQRQAEYRRRAEEGRRERQARQEERERLRQVRQEEYRRRTEERERLRQAQQEEYRRYFNSLSPEEQRAEIQKQREQKEAARRAMGEIFMHMLINEDGGSSSSEERCRTGYIRRGSVCSPDPATRRTPRYR